LTSKSSASALSQHLFRAGQTSPGCCTQLQILVINSSSVPGGRNTNSRTSASPGTLAATLKRHTRRMKKLIIFDMDGVLLDSEKLYMDMNQAFFKKLGAKISIDEHQTFVGISATKMWTYIKEKFHLLQTVDELKELEKELKNKTLKETTLVPTFGVIDFLEFLKQKDYVLTIASSGLRKNIDLILQKLAMEKYFDFVVSGEQVMKGKPEPDIFLKVADHYNRDSKDCIVIEDSYNGVLAAKAANMFCIGYYNPNSGNQDLSKADIIIDSFKDTKLFDLIEH
jgi:HAD superfamily hydrolase (TIGR01509 family)